MTRVRAAAARNTKNAMEVNGDHTISAASWHSIHKAVNGIICRRFSPIFF